MELKKITDFIHDLYGTKDLVPLAVPVFVSNCDILINDDYAEVLDYHHENKNELTVVAAIKTYTIPYGTITTGKNGLIERIEEKTGSYFQNQHRLLYFRTLIIR